MSVYSESAQRIQQQLQSQPNWQEKYRVLLQAGKEAQPLAAEYRTDDYKVTGCEANVWLLAEGSATNLQLHFFSDARLVHALVHVALLPMQQQSADFIARFDTTRWLQQCALDDHLSPSRSNGLQQVIKRAKQLALAQATSD
ncbi:Fe-S metabolism protein SufE [Aliidiomarina minuta]|uniref:Fe-S metabolism protein SufE n=1 Tax=Aliidiomarina minuta TaxID=880057 RepID=A0A432WA25_9GAMM|nr:SufE family protein [Aliidiomarina minuta]RUO26458.1 Fe-S metabolism protein SufE [Aliidiomarina minuta]